MGQQLRKPDDLTCWGGETVPQTDDEQQTERRCCLAAIEETGTQYVARYWGAHPLRHRCTITLSLYLTRSGTSSQWSRCRWLHEPPHSVILAAACLSWPWAPPRKLRYSRLIDAGRHECVNECRSRVPVDWTQGTRVSTDDGEGKVWRPLTTVTLPPTSDMTSDICHACCSSICYTNVSLVWSLAST